VFEAGLVGLGAATLYALVLVLLRTTGAARPTAAGCCAILLLALVLLARDPAAAFAALHRGPAGAISVAIGALAGVALAAVGPDSRLLFLPALLLLATVGTAAGPRRTLAATALATAGLLAPLLGEPAAVGDRWLLALTAAGLLAIPPLLAALVARVSEPADRPPEPHVAVARPGPGHIADPDPMPVELLLLTNSDPPRIATTAPSRAPSPLTPRQLEAVELTAAGLRHAEIAERLGVSIHQVRRLLRQGRERVHASTTRQLVAWAMMAGIVGPVQGTETSETESRPPDD
jgi:DNA-binding CsgD family transcriptional regulator